ncbi:MAG: YesL family protein [Dorea sp.]
MKLFNYDSKFMRFFLFLSHVTLLNLTWLICCLPIVTAGASTAAQHYSAKQLIAGDTHVFKNFCIGFKNYWKTSSVLWIIFLILAAVFVFDYNLISANDLPAEMVILIISVLAFITLVFTMIWSFPVMVNFSGNAREIFFNAFMFSFMFAPLTLVTVVLIAVMLVGISKNMFIAALLILFGPTLIAYITLTLFEKAFTKYRSIDAEVGN